LIQPERGANDDDDDDENNEELLLEFLPHKE
jgi:hypothetical protein